MRLLIFLAQCKNIMTAQLLEKMELTVEAKEELRKI